MVIIITPKTGWLRRLHVIECEPGEAFEDFQRINDLFWEARDAIDITLQHIPLDDVPDWIDNNVEPNWWEKLLGRIRYDMWVRNG